MARWKKHEVRFSKVTRDIIMFFTGISLTIHEAVIRHGPDRPYLLILFGAMMGLPFVMRGDEWKRNGNGKDQNNE